MGEYRFEPFGTPARGTEYLRALIESAEEEVLLSASEPVLEAVEPALEDAVDRGVLVLLLLGGSHPDEVSVEFERVASVVHVWEEAELVSIICTADGRNGLCAGELVFEQPTSTDDGVVFSHPLLRTHLFSTVIGNTWNRAPEVYVDDPDPLPSTYENFPTAVVNATLHLRADNELTAEIRGRRVGTTEETVIEGQVCNVRQSFIAPITNSFPVENSLFVRCDGDVLSVGGPGAFIENVEAFEVTLRQGEAPTSGTDPADF